jgi:3-oxoadipate CoA-transferase alpha subunit
MIDKISASMELALESLRDGATIMVGGFGGAGQPNELIDGLLAHGAQDLVLISNNAGNGTTGLAALLAAGRA